MVTKKYAHARKECIEHHFGVSKVTFIKLVNKIMTTIRSLPSMSSVETLLDTLCTRVLFGGITKTLLEAPTEEAAAQAVLKLQCIDHKANYRFNDKHSAWHVTVYH